ncbi:MAG: DUF3386 domain-containing protein [Symploca sp. SIO1A3]|nr:DUF3386 domain-containing protein [Symploca sp. SIO1A3]
MTEPKSACELFKAAYENRYTWDENFPGYSADIEIKQGNELYTGTIRINSDFTVEVSGFQDEKVQESIYNQIRDLITHRKRTSFEKAHGKNEFSLGDTDDTGAVAILVNGNAMGSNYKVKDTEICYVSRVVGSMAFSINTKASLDTGEGYVPSDYSAIFRNSQTGELLAEREFKDTFGKVGDYYLMTRQVIHSIGEEDKTTTEFNFSNIRLLEPAIV